MLIFTHLTHFYCYKLVYYHYTWKSAFWHISKTISYQPRQLYLVWICVRPCSKLSWPGAVLYLCQFKVSSSGSGIYYYRGQWTWDDTRISFLFSTWDDTVVHIVKLSYFSPVALISTPLFGFDGHDKLRRKVCMCIAFLYIFSLLLILFQVISRFYRIANSNAWQTAVWTL